MDLRDAHSARVIRTTPLLRNLAVMIAMLALAVRIAIPSGWMPAGDKAFALTVCIGMDVGTVWLDKQGRIHKEDPGKSGGKTVDHAPCAFAANGGAAGLPTSLAGPATAPATAAPSPFPAMAVSIGHGLAAPPPPAIGPPALV